MHIVIMGCGRVGSTLAHILEDRGNTVAVIDRDPEAFRRLRPAFKGDRVTGIGFDRDVLARAGIERADSFAAVSSGDNSNIIAARVARETFGVRQVAARIYDPRRAEVYERLGIPTVATVRWTADQMLRKLLPEGAEPLWRDPTGGVQLAEVHASAAWVGQRISKLQAETGVRRPARAEFPSKTSGTTPAFHLRWRPIRATLRSPRGFDQIRLGSGYSGFKCRGAPLGPPGFSISGIGRVLQ